MDEWDLFGTTPCDWEFGDGAEFASNFQDEQYPSQASALFDEFGIDSRSCSDALDRIGWQLYFPNKDVQTCRTTNKHIRCLVKHYHDYRCEYSPLEAESSGSFEFKLNLARTDICLKDAWPTLQADIEAFPEYTIACMGLAMYRTVAATHQADPFSPETLEIPKITARLHLFGPEQSISTIDASYTDKLVTIGGTIVHVSEPIVTSTLRAYKCRYCHDTIVLERHHNRHTTRQWICEQCNAGGGIEYCSASVLNRDEAHQLIIVQDARVSKTRCQTIEVKVRCALVDGLQAGDNVTITGVLKIDSSKFVAAICIRKDLDNGTIERNVNSTDVEVINAIRSEACLFKLLVQSLCPAVVGLETVKAGLLLALFSTTGDVHVLLADIDSGKSQKLLDSCMAASPKGFVENDPYRDEVRVQYLMAKSPAPPGQGVCCIERIDKMDKLEMLEKMLTDTPPQTTLLVTVMPNRGVLDTRKPFLDNFILPRNLMEKFALVFLMEDVIIPPEELVCSDGVRTHPETPSASKCSVEIPLVRQLRLKPGEHCDRLPIELLQKYIDYARSHCNPEFTEESMALLERFFSEMYSMPHWLNIANGVKMAQIKNMALARARIDLSPAITTEHVMDTVRIVSRSWYDRYDTDDRAPTVQLPAKKGGVKAASIRQILEVLRARSVEHKTKSFSLKELRALIEEEGMPGFEDEIIEKLNIQGYLLKKSAGCYRLLV
ncbi:DNA helicase MCM8-like [Anopheles arabiensis]|uniref:DNA helicase MCM8-like n=1 Tax=Anopheles arabiensis TaxID=7173 RepID=UPI001AAE12ED|nr:DNA helicase MCM8-like [Anopheles arabiensis]